MQKINLKKKNYVKKVFNNVYNKYDVMNDIMSLGIHRLWKKDLISWLAPQKNSSLIDVASGTGDLTKLFLKSVQNNGNAYCVDNNKLMLKKAKSRFKSTKNIKWYIADAEKLPFKNNYFDYYIISFGIRNVFNIDKSLSEANRVLKIGGRFLCLEFSKIDNEYLNKFYNYYSRIIPKIGEYMIGNPKPYEYLTKSINQFYTQEELVEKLLDARFGKITFKNLCGGIAAIHSAWKI